MTETSKTPDLSLESLIAWLERRPADDGYPSTNASCCMLAQWIKSIDPKGKRAGRGNSWEYEVGGEFFDLGHFSDIAIGPERDTFGAALERARKLSRADAA